MMAFAPSESHLSGRLNISLQPPRVGSFIFSGSPECRRKEVHCYFPHSPNFTFALDQMIQNIKEQSGDPLIHHVEMTLFLEDAPVQVISPPVDRDATAEQVMSNDEETPVDTDDINDEEFDPHRPEIFKYRPVKLRNKKHHQVLSGMDHKRLISRRNNSTSKIVSCKVCGRQLLKYSIKNHMRTHLQAKPFSCTLCGGEFGHKFSLERHLLAIHHVAEPYPCDSCPQKFKKEHLLAKHKQLHSRCTTRASDH